MYSLEHSRLGPDIVPIEKDIGRAIERVFRLKRSNLQIEFNQKRYEKAHAELLEEVVIRRREKSILIEPYQLAEHILMANRCVLLLSSRYDNPLADTVIADALERAAKSQFLARVDTVDTRERFKLELVSGARRIPPRRISKLHGPGYIFPSGRSHGDPEMLNEIASGRSHGDPEVLKEIVFYASARGTAILTEKRHSGTLYKEHLHGISIALRKEQYQGSVHGYQIDTDEDLENELEPATAQLIVALDLLKRMNYFDRKMIELVAAMSGYRFEILEEICGDSGITGLIQSYMTNAASIKQFDTAFTRVLEIRNDTYTSTNGRLMLGAKNMLVNHLRSLGNRNG